MRRADTDRALELSRRLRERLGDDAKQPTYIVTELRVGYRMPEPTED